MEYAEVVLDITNKNVDKPFTYKIPEDMKDKIAVGRRVIIPFGKGNMMRKGYVIGLTNTISFDENLVKYIHEIPDNYEIFDENMIKLASFMSDKYYCTMSECLQCITPNVSEDRVTKYVVINHELPEIQDKIVAIAKKGKLQGKVLEYLQNFDKPVEIDKLKKELNISISPINSLIKAEILLKTEKEFRKNIFEVSKFEKTSSLNLNQEQQSALEVALKIYKADQKKPLLINGVTGSGKTEVYMQIIQEVINSGKEAIVLVPEISLTPQTVDRFVSRFGNKVSVTHSKINSRDRLEQWKKAKDGEISIMVGARSAIFTPFKNLGVVIIDEEHEKTYKADQTPKYDTREVANKLCELNGALLVLGSATPSIESYYKAKNNEYELIHIENRVNKTPTEVTIVDMRKELASGNKSIFSKILFEAINENLSNNMQTILFLNRRGHSTFISCRECGTTLECDNCNVNYTYHIDRDILTCHYCGSNAVRPKICPKCGSEQIKYFGVGTQKVEEHVEKYFPNARVLRMDMDATSKKDGHKKILEKFKNHKADILIGTQMIAKGLDFPKVSLVGVIAGDAALNTGSYMSSENCFQLLTQVCGRAGRAETAGKAFIQTYNPEDYSIVFAKNNDYYGFYEREILERRMNFYPPFSNIFIVMISGEDEDKVLKCITYLHKVMIYYNQRTNFDIMDATKTSIYKAKNQYRYKIIIKALEEVRVKNFVVYCVDVLKKNMNTKDLLISLSLNPSYV